MTILPPPDWTVIIRCPGCGQTAGEVVQHPGRPMRALLRRDVPSTLGCEQRECPGLRWPDEATVLRAARRAVRHPRRRVSIRATAEPATVVVGGVEWIYVRSDRLGEGAAEYLTRSAARRAERYRARRQT